VVSSLWPVETAIFSWANFEKCTLSGIRMFRIGWLLVGFLLMLGKLGAKGKDFFATDLKISTIFKVLGFWSWVLGLGFCVGLISES
jgi:hypothetical protein